MTASAEDENGPERLLAAARTLLERGGAAPAGVWPRASALLVRQALEESLGRYWRARGMALEDCSARAQFICLAEYERKDSATVVALNGAWHALSRACHHHAYELQPTAAELLGWLEVVEAWTRRPPREGPEVAG